MRPARVWTRNDVGLPSHEPHAPLAQRPDPNCGSRHPYSPLCTAHQRLRPSGEQLQPLRENRFKPAINPHPQARVWQRAAWRRPAPVPLTPVPANLRGYPCPCPSEHLCTSKLDLALLLLGWVWQWESMKERECALDVNCVFVEVVQFSP